MDCNNLTSYCTTESAFLLIDVCEVKSHFVDFFLCTCFFTSAGFLFANNSGQTILARKVNLFTNAMMPYSCYNQGIPPGNSAFGSVNEEMKC